MKSEVKSAVKHTPGPWRIVQRDEQGTFNGRRITIEGGPGMIADLDWNTPQQNLANARLIAAAPELLEALKGIVDNEHECTCGGECDGQCWHSIALRAITKATGETL